MNMIRLIRGISTFIPGFNKIYRKNTGGTCSARYCYSVWLRHLVMASKNGLDPYPKIIAELGPGDSLGIGLAALISGCEKYYAFDVVEYADSAKNIQILEEIVRLFTRKEDIPNDKEFPKLKPYLKDYSFPKEILTDDILKISLQADRLSKIRKSILDLKSEKSVIRYVVPWDKSDIIEAETVDLIYSQAVLEHVDNLIATYKSMHNWLKKDGYISHQIDLKSHSTATAWNGHWALSDLAWRMIRGNRPYLINREPHSRHLQIMLEQGFAVICDEKYLLQSKISRKNLAPRFRYFSDEDLITSGAFIQARKAKVP